MGKSHPRKTTFENGELSDAYFHAHKQEKRAESVQSISLKLLREGGGFHHTSTFCGEGATREKSCYKGFGRNVKEWGSKRPTIRKGGFGSGSTGGKGKKVGKRGSSRIKDTNKSILGQSKSKKKRRPKKKRFNYIT